MNHSKERYLPEYVRTPHLPHNPNVTPDDLIASSNEAAVIFQSTVDITDKIDGASCGMTVIDGEPVIRNRTHILRKGYVKETAAKKQFAPVFNWWYKNKKLFNRLPSEMSVYGEWCMAAHGVKYDKLPSLFMTYDLYDQDAQQYVETVLARKLLLEAGFAVVPLLFHGKVESYEQLEALRDARRLFRQPKIERAFT